MLYHIDWPFKTRIGSKRLVADIEADSDEAMLLELQASLPERCKAMAPWPFKGKGRWEGERLAKLPLLDLLAELAKNWNAQCGDDRRLYQSDIASPEAFVERARQIGTVTCNQPSTP